MPLQSEPKSGRAPRARRLHYLRSVRSVVTCDNYGGSKTLITIPRLREISQYVNRMKLSLNNPRGSDTV